MVKHGYILLFTMIMLAMGTAIITQVFYTGNLYNSYVSVVLDKERARQLAISGVSVAMSQLMLLDRKLSPPKEKEKKEEKPDKNKKRTENQKKLLEVILQVQNRWQTFILNQEVDGIDAELKICISCESGKIDCNKLYNLEVKKFIASNGRSTEPLFKLVGEKLTPFLRSKNITDSVMSFIKTQKRPMLTPTEFLKDKKLATVFDNYVFYIPSESEMKNKKTPVYLADIFTVHGESRLSMWSLSSSLQKTFGLYSEKKMTSDRAKEIVKKLIPTKMDNIPKEIDTFEKISHAFELIYGGKNNAFPKELLEFLDPKFEPRLFSVLCYAKVGRVGQKLLAIIEKAPMKDGEMIKMIETYWI